MFKFPQIVSFVKIKFMKMSALQKQYIQDDKGNNVGVILSLEEYQAIIERVEELEDIIAYDKAKKEPSDTIPFDIFLKELQK